MTAKIPSQMATLELAMRFKGSSNELATVANFLRSRIEVYP